jgi:predicted acylesterase/phospholipase RssA
VAVRDEIRLAVALYGGVSLAVYEAGVAHELYRAVRGDGAYRAALGEGRRVVVDVVAGTSAGGITGGVLAAALATGADLTALRRLWLDRADLAALVHRSNGAVPSLLDGERLRAAIADALPAADAAPLVDDLVAYLTLTDLAGRPVWYLDSLGRPILATSGRHHAVFDRDTLRSAPGADAARARTRLADAMRATAAFPGAFAPHRLDGRWYADGGILDNKPLGLALRGIRDRHSAVREHRMLVFVEPHPAGAPAGLDPVSVPHPLETLAAALALALDDSVLEDLRGIDDVNMRIAWYHAFRELFDLFVADRARRRDDVLADRVLAAPLDDLAVDVRFCLEMLGGRSAAWTAWRRLWPSLRAAGVDPIRLARRLLEEAAADADLHLRWFRWIVRERIDPVLDAAGASEDLAAAMRGLAGADDRGLRALKPWIAEECIAPLRAAWRASGVPDAVAAWVADPPGDLAAGAEALVADARRLAEAAGLRAVATRCRAALERAAADPAAGRVFVAFETFRRYDAYSLVVEAAGDLTGKRRVDVVRVSPRDADNLSLIGRTAFPADQAADKLAGEVLGHFGGFLDRGWRRNDYIWGRLDAAEILLRAIAATPPALPTSALAALVADARREILVDEHRAYNAERGRPDAPVPDPIGHPHRNLPLIGRGRERFADLPPERRAELFGYLLQTVPRMLQAPGTMPATAAVLGALRAAGTVLRVLAVPLLLLAAPAPTRWSRLVGALLLSGLLATLLVLAGAYTAGRIGVAATLALGALGLGATALAYVLGAAVGRPGRGWLVVLVAAGVAAGAALRPTLERLLVWLRAP